MAGFSDNEVNALHSLAGALERATDLEALCWAVQAPVEAFGFPDCVLYVREGSLLTQMSATGPKRLPGNQLADRIALRMGEGIVGGVAANGEPCYVRDVGTDARYVQDVIPGGSEFAVPILHRDAVIGVLDCEHPDINGVDEHARAQLLAIADITAPHLGLLLERRSLDGALTLGSVAAELARLPAIGAGELDQVVPAIVERAARSLRAARVNAWVFEAEAQKLSCLQHFELSSATHQVLPAIDLKPLARYARALTEERVVIANEAQHDARTRELTLGYLKPNAITAMLDAPIRVDGRVAGVLCVEHAETSRRWTGEEAAFVATLSDFLAMTLLHREKAAAERSLLHAQKVESLGRLAGGVAHDFNNLLTVLAASVDMLAASPTLSDSDRKLVRNIGDVRQRAAALTSKLLALGRRQQMDMRGHDLGHLVDDVMELVRKALPASVMLNVEHRQPTPVSCDAAQIELVVTNLVLNAADAMPDGGALDVRTSVVVGAEGVAMAQLEVCDNGVGLSSDLLEAVFEPFFSTKGEGGSGLGLAVSQGVVHQHGGSIEVHSAPGAGATFAVYLPLRQVEPQPVGGVPREATAYVLVVEDDPGVRQVMSNMLELLGVAAVITLSAADALQHIEAETPALLVSDVIMPDVNGPELYAQALALRPELPVLFISGYSESLLGNLPYPSERFGFLAKPFTVRDLGRALKRFGVSVADGEVGQA